MSGSVSEAETDIRLPSPVGMFTLHRTYNGDLDDEGALGSNWLTNTNNAFLKKDGSDYLLVETASSSVPFTSDGTGGYDAPDYSSLELTVDTDELIVTNARTGKVWVFHGFAVSDGDWRGKLKEATSQQWRAAGRAGTVFAYGSAGRLRTITTSGDQSYRVLFGYAGGRITSLTVSEEVSSSTYEDYRRLTYTYFLSGTHDPDVGKVGDLVQVKNSYKMSDGNWLDRYTQYRYEDDGKIKGVFRNGSIQRLLDLDSGLTTPNDILESADAYNLSGSTSDLKELADRWFEYYVSPADTTNLITPWDAGGEDLEKYLPPASSGSYNRNETGFVKSERIVEAGCSSCSSAIVREYAYLELDQGTTNGDNEVKYLVVEDTRDVANNKISRVVIGLNARGKKLRTAKTFDPTVGTPNFWCRSWRLAVPSDYSGSDSRKRNRIMEYRVPSAHKGPGSIDIKKFFDPYDDASGGSWANDEATLKAASDSGCGPTYTYAYNSSGRLTEARVKRGKDSSSEYLLRAREYGDGVTVPAHEPTKIYTYPTKETTVTFGECTQFAYSYWDTEKTQLQSVTTTKPTVSSGNNGSGQAATSTVYYDKAGRMRWAIDELGYISYFSYDKQTGQLGFAANDVDPESLPTDATASHLVSEDDDGDTDGDYQSGTPSRDTNLPAALNRSVLFTYDQQGRRVSTNPSFGLRSAIVYEEDRTIYFTGIDSSGVSKAPIFVRAFGLTGKVTEEYRLRADYSDITVANNLPTEFSEEPNQDDYITWTRYDYDGYSEALLSVDRYHDIPSTGTGIISDNFHRTGYHYDSQGRREYVVSQLSGDPAGSDGVEDVFQLVYDAAGRVCAKRRGVNDASIQIGSGYTNTGSTPTLTTVSQTFFDGATGTTASELKVGENRVTRTTHYHTTDGLGMPDDYSIVENHYDFRGRLRGSERFYNGDTSSESIGPYSVADYDWLGRLVAMATYDTVPDWSTITSGDGDGAYAEAYATNRRGLGRMKYDAEGRIYQTEQVVVKESDGSVVAVQRSNSYHNLRGDLVATGDGGGVSQEYAFDGLGRQYQQRTVLALEGTKYTSGAFQYVAPVPDPNFSAMSGGNDGVIVLSHGEYDESSNNVIATHAVDSNHSDTDGFSLASGQPTGGVRATTHSYYDEQSRLVTKVSYGAGDEDDGAVEWGTAAVPVRDTGDSTSFTSNANRLVTQISYNPSTLSMETMTDPSGSVQKTFYDDLGRQILAVDNYVDATIGNPPTNLGGGTEDDEDRAVGWVYNAGGQLIELNAYNGSSETQTTKYFHEDDYNSALVTKTTYPAFNSTPSDAADLVQTTYNLDGSIHTRTDQRGVVMTYLYDDARRPRLEAASSIPASVDDAVQAIGRTYDTLGRVKKVTSYDGTTTSSDVVNEIEYDYHPDHGRVTKIAQSHSGEVDPAAYFVAFSHDASSTGGVYDHDIRTVLYSYPGVFGGCQGEIYYGAANSLTDRLSRPMYLKMWDGGLRTGSYSHSIRPYYTGAGRLARLWSESGATGFNTALDYSGGSGYIDWDRFGRVVKQEWKRGSATVDQIDYAYDTAGNRTLRNVAAATNDTRDQVYTYDDLNRVRSSDQGKLLSTTMSASNEQRYWDLDQLGNWDKLRDGLSSLGTLLEERTHNASNELTGFTTPGTNANPVHDAAGNMTTIPKPSDLTNSYMAKYDAWSRLVSLDDGTTASYQYDGLGRRIVRIVPIEVSDTTHFYYNDQWQVLTETNESDDATAIYLYQPDYVDAVAVRMTSTDHPKGEGEHFYLSDALYNVTGLLERGSDSTVVERYAYSAYGEPTILDTDYSADSDGLSDVGNEYLYTGRRLDPGSRLQLNRHRYYHQQLGRWTARDPLGYDGGGYSLYLYTKAIPTVMLDPEGTHPYDSTPDGPYDSFFRWCYGIDPPAPPSTPPPPPPPPPLPCIKIPNKPGLVPAPPIPPGGWHSGNIGRCYSGSKACNKKGNANDGLRCQDGCDACFKAHQAACIINPFIGCFNNGPAKKLNQCNARCLLP